MSWWNPIDDIKSVAGVVGDGLKAVGHYAAPVIHRGAQVGGAVGGFMLGGPQGAMAGEQLGDKIGNIEQDALQGRGVGDSIKRNALGAATAGAGLYATKRPGGGISQDMSGPPSIGSASDAAGTFVPGGVGDVGNAPDGSSGGGGWTGGSGGGSDSGSGVPLIGGALDYLKGHGVDVGSLLGGAKDALTGNGGANALALGAGASAALTGKKSLDLADNALGTTQANWDRQQPLRTAGQAGMLNPGAGIGSAIAAIPQGRNVYAQPQAGPPKLGAAVCPRPQSATSRHP